MSTFVVSSGALIQQGDKEMAPKRAAKQEAEDDLGITQASLLRLAAKAQKAGLTTCYVATLGFILCFFTVPRLIEPTVRALPDAVMQLKLVREEIKDIREELRNSSDKADRQLAAIHAQTQAFSELGNELRATKGRNRTVIEPVKE